MPTKVIYRTLDGEIIALFPTLPGDSSPDTCLSYMHIGQHGPATAELLGKSAKPEEYGPLAQELRIIGYRLETVYRFTLADYQTRKNAISER